MHVPTSSANTGVSALSLAAAPVPDRIAAPTVEVLGIPLALTDYGQTMAWMDAMIARRERGYVCVAAVHTVMACQEDHDLRGAVLNSSLIVPDGQPLVWAMNGLGHDLSSRVYGPELMDRYCARAAETGSRMYLYGGRNQGALVQLALNFRRRHPGLKIVGGYSPPYGSPSEEEDRAVAEEINRSKADIVWVGIGVPKQEKWICLLYTSPSPRDS